MLYYIRAISHMFVLVLMSYIQMNNRVTIYLSIMSVSVPLLLPPLKLHATGFFFSREMSERGHIDLTHHQATIMVM